MSDTNASAEAAPESVTVEVVHKSNKDKRKTIAATALDTYKNRGYVPAPKGK